MTHNCNHSAWKIEARKSEVTGQPWVQSEFETCLGYMRSCLITKITALGLGAAGRALIPANKTIDLQSETLTQKNRKLKK